MRPLILIVCLLFCLQGLAQQLFDRQHSMAYMHALFKDGDYRQTYEELARYNSMYPDERDDSICVLTLKTCYRLGYHTALFEEINKVQPSSSYWLRNSAAGLALVSDSVSVFYRLVSKGVTCSDELALCALFLSDSFGEARHFLSTHPATIADTGFYAGLLNEQQAYPRKRESIALLASVLIPGAGKYYLQQPADATALLALSGIHGFLAVNAFAHAGASSVFGWVNAVVFSGLYAANLVGTHRAAVRYEHKINRSIHHAVTDKVHSLAGM